MKQRSRTAATLGGGAALLLATLGAAGPATASEPVAPARPAAATDSVPAGAPQYDIAGVLPEDDFPGPVGRGMNELGSVVGWTGYPLKAFSWNPSSGPTLLPGLAGDTHRVAVDINDAGVAVGHSGYETIEPPQHAVRWVGGVPQDLGTLPGGGDSHAEALNEAGTVVGWAYSGSNTHAFVWTEDGGMVDITPTAMLGYAYDVNESGQVTGYVNSHAYVWEDGVLTDLGVPAGYAYSFGFAINDAGVVAAHVTTASGNSERVARWTPGIGWEVLGGVGELNVSWGINNDGTIVGEGRPSAGLERAFVYLDGVGLLSLTELLPTDEWFLLRAYDVDDAGRITVQAHNRETGDSAVLLLEPVRATVEDQRLRVSLRGEPEPTGAQARLKVVDQGGSPVGGAVVRGTWRVDGEVIGRGAKDKTDAKGKAKITVETGELTSGQVVAFCITKIIHPDYVYDPPTQSCASTTVP